LKATTPDAATNATLAASVQAQQAAQKDAEAKQEAANTKVAAAQAATAAADTADKKTAAGAATTAAQKAQDDADQARQRADLAAKTVYAQIQAAADQFGSIYSVCERNGYSNILNRVSFFYGRSVGGFDDKVVQGDINAFGIAIDVAPQFSILWGR